MTNKIAFVLRGGDEDDGLVRMPEFIRFLEFLLTSLRRLEADLGHPKSACYRISDLHPGSAVVEVEAVRRKGASGSPERVVNTFKRTVRSLAAGSAPPPELTPRTLAAFRDLVQPLHGTMASITLVDQGEAPILLTKDIEQRVERLIGEDAAFEGVITGHVDAVNVHDELLFFLYPPAMPAKAACHFPRESLDDVRQAIKRYVTVTGLLLCRKNSHLPFRVDALALEIHPPESQLPTFMSLRGSIPDLTGGLSSVQYVRQQRDAQA